MGMVDTPLVQALWRYRQAGLWIQGQLGLLHKRRKNFWKGFLRVHLTGH